MNRFDGTSARQLDLLDDMDGEAVRPRTMDRMRPAMRLLRRDVYAELARRRRRAQIAARHELDKAPVED
jgi:hypothetical protein